MYQSASLRYPTILLGSLHITVLNGMDWPIELMLYVI